MSPMFDRICECGWIGVDILEPIEAEHVCPNCSQHTKRAWVTKPPTAIGDAMDATIRNGARHPIRFTSKAEFARWRKEHNYRIRDEHVGSDPGTDRSKLTTKMVAGGKDWLKNAEILASRNGSSSGSVPPNPADGFHINWSFGTLTPEQASDYRKQVK